MKSVLLRKVAVVIGVLALWVGRAEAEVKIVRPEPDNQNRLTIVSDGAMPWKLRYWSLFSQRGAVEPRLVPVSADRMLFIQGLTLHLIDTRNGVVLGRWIFANRIGDVRVDGEKFNVQTVTGSDKSIRETLTITPDSPSPPHWLDGLLLQRYVVTEGSWFDIDARLETEYQADRKGPSPRAPLAPKDVEGLIVEVEDAARRDPFSPQLGVCLALLMRDLGRKDAEAVFRRAIERPTNSYGELFAIANNLENGAETEWSTLAFEQAYARLWQQGADPRMMYALLPRLMLLYLPYDLRKEIPDARRAELLERVYLLGPYVEQSSLAWTRLAAYFDQRGDAKNAALWRTRANESAAKMGYVWEPKFYLERTTRVLVALFLSILLYYVILQRRYAPQRRLLRAGKSWWRGLLRLSPLSMTCWDRQDRRILYGLLVLFWLAQGLWGGLGQEALLSQEWPTAGASGTLRAPKTLEFVKGLPLSPDRDFLMALSFQQDEKYGEAETLYGKLPDSGEKWNNLGVLQQKQGRDGEARESFEHALRIDPESVEATFNLDRRVSDRWAEMHSKYLPGQKMLALPSHDAFYGAIRGSRLHFAGQILRGPFLGVPTHAKAVGQYNEFNYYDSRQIPPHGLADVLLYLVLCSPFAVALTALLSPYREVTQPSGRWHWLVELAFPGTARQWGRAGGVLLAVAIWGVLQFLSASHRWTPFGIAGDSKNGFGLPPSLPDLTGIVWPVDPGWFWNHGIFSLAVLVFAANAIVVIAAQRRLRLTAT